MPVAAPPLFSETEEIPLWENTTEIIEERPPERADYVNPPPRPDDPPFPRTTDAEWAQIEADYRAKENQPYKREPLGQVLKEGFQAGMEEVGAGPLGLPAKALALVPKPTAQQVQDALDVIGNPSELSKPSRPPSEAAKAIAGTVGVGRGVAESLASPLGVATLGAGGLPGLAPKAVSAAFLADILHSVPEQARRAGEASVTGDLQEKVEAYGGLGITPLMAGAIAAHVAAPIPPRIIENIAKADAIGLNRSAQALADTVRREQISDQVQQLEKPIEGIQNVESPLEKPAEIKPVEESAAAPALPSEPARAQGVKEGQVLLVDQIDAMPHQDFVKWAREQEGGYTTAAYKMGEAMQTPEGAARLREMESKVEAERKAAFEAEDIEAAMNLANKKQFVTEALEGAVGVARNKINLTAEQVAKAKAAPITKSAEVSSEPAGFPKEEYRVVQGDSPTRPFTVQSRRPNGKFTNVPGANYATRELASATKERLQGTGVEPLPEPVAASQAVRAKNAPTEAAAAAKAQPELPGTVEPVPQSMGGLNPKTEQAKAQLAQLTDSIATLAAEGKTRPAEAFSLGETLSKAKDSATAALEGLKAVGSYMKLKLEGKPIATEYKGVLGDRHLALSESSVNARKWRKDVLKALPDPKVREAISNWVDAGGDAATLTKAASETKPRYQEGYERAQKLTPEERTVAENLKNYFDSRLQEAIDAGVLEDGIENYIHRIYEQDSPWKKGVIQELRSGLFTGRPALAKQRVFEYDFEAEKAGKHPIKDFAKRVTAYDLSLNKAIADRQAVKAMLEIKMSDGRPMIDVGGGGKVIENAAGEPQATFINRSQKKIDASDPKADRGDFKTYDHPALRKWKWAATDSAGKPIFVQGDVLIHPEAISAIQKLLGRSAIRQNPIGRAALGVSSTIKQTMLDLSGFHPVQIAVHGTEHRTFAPVKEIDFTNPDVRGLIRGGAAVGETSGHAAFSEGVSGAGSSLTKHIPWVGERLQAYNSWLFEDYIPRLKVAMGLHALERNRARFKDLSPDQLYELTANQMNAAFGEQNYTMLGRSKTTQDALRLALLAPDFLEARSRFVAQAFTKYGAEQRQALLLGAATMYITARLINKMLDDEYHFEPKNAFNVVYGGKSYGLRTVQGDLVHAVTEPGKFINHRLNPVYGKPALEFVTGRDYFGRERTVGEQLKDFAKTPVPIGVRGAFENQEQTLFESFLNSFGLVTKRDSAASDISKLAQKWKEKNKISTGPGAFVYDAEKDPYRPIKLAAERNDEAGVRSEVTKAMNEGITHTRILNHFKLSEAHNFTGSAANERKFVESLTEDEKKIYADAKAERERIRKLVRRVMPSTPNPNP